jgi:hypothetical protein
MASLELRDNPIQFSAAISDPNVRERNAIIRAQNVIVRKSGAGQPHAASHNCGIFYESSAIHVSFRILAKVYE